MPPDAVELLCTTRASQGSTALQQQQQLQQLHQQHLLQLGDQQAAAAAVWAMSPHAFPAAVLGTPQHAMQMPRYGFVSPPPSPALVPQQPVPAPGGGDATRQALLGDSPARQGGAMTSWALEERLKAEQARAQQLAWAEGMRAQYLGIPAAAPDRRVTPAQTPQKATPEKTSSKKQDASTAFDRLLLLSKLGAAWDQHQAEKQAAERGGSPPAPRRPRANEEAKWWSAKEDAFRTPTKKESWQSGHAGKAKGRNSRSGRA